MERVCYVCGAPATCLGRYEGHGPEKYGCDDCCGHGCEDGHCTPVDELPAGRVPKSEAELDAEAQTADTQYLQQLEAERAEREQKVTQDLLAFTNLE
jgi:hypothetical protein